MLTQDERAQTLGVDRSTVAKWETGQRSLIVENLIWAVAVRMPVTAVNVCVPVDRLFGRITAFTNEPVESVRTRP